MKSFTLPLLLLLAFWSCTPMKMSVSKEFAADAQELAVKGRQGLMINQKLHFGDYSTSKVKRSWTRGTSGQDALAWGSTPKGDWRNLIAMEYIDKKQTLAFSMEEQGKRSEVYAVSNFNAQDLHLGNNPNSLLNIVLDVLGEGVTSQSLYYAQLYLNEDTRPWELVLDNQLAQARPQEYIGYLAKSQDEFYTLVPVTRMEAKGEAKPILFGSMGYEIKNPAGKTVAAVSLIDGGKVYLSNNTSEERFLMANLCATLLLQEQLD